MNMRASIGAPVLHIPFPEMTDIGVEGGDWNSQITP